MTVKKRLLVLGIKLVVVTTILFILVSVAPLFGIEDSPHLLTFIAVVYLIGWLLGTIEFIIEITIGFYER